ncbi:APC family permease [Falsihalocynthiibacter sp. BN13B15]|uniref:APC family permease n=1 Tax=Falsihalocynthiibacter sp. BN13B15 TaxID=3240871 RepID=UPI00350F91CA
MPKTPFETVNPDSKKLGTLSTLSIGLGGMVGGGIFAVTGLTIELTKQAAPLAFVIAGIVALLTSYSYLKLTLAYPGEGGTVDFLCRGFGTGLFTGAANILLLLSYVVLLAIYAYAFGSYGADLFPHESQNFLIHLLTSGVIIGLVGLNVLAAKLVIKSENVFNIIKMVLLVGFIIAGFLTPMDWTRLDPVGAVTPVALIAGSMLIFLNFEGFELIANASKDVADPRRSLPIAYIGGVLIVIALYVLIVSVVLGHMSLEQVGANRDTALSAAGRGVLGKTGYIAIVVAALMATSSAINATFFSTGRLAYVIAKTGQLPKEIERTIRNEHSEGAIICAALALIVANFIPLQAIATAGSAGFLLLFFFVNVASVRLAKETGARAWISGLAAFTTAGALGALCWKVAENPATRSHLVIVGAMIVASVLIEFLYRSATGRKISLRRHKAI